MNKTISILGLTQKNISLKKKQVRYFMLHQHVQVFSFESMLMNKYFEMGVRERTLLGNWFVKACVYIKS